MESRPGAVPGLRLMATWRDLGAGDRPAVLVMDAAPDLADRPEHDPEVVRPARTRARPSALPAEPAVPGDRQDAEVADRPRARAAPTAAAARTGPGRRSSPGSTSRGCSHSPPIAQTSDARPPPRRPDPPPGRRGRPRPPGTGPASRRAARPSPDRTARRRGPDGPQPDAGEQGRRMSAWQGPRKVLIVDGCTTTNEGDRTDGARVARRSGSGHKTQG